ncbi:ATP-binding protein [Nocardia sp. NPDC058658]|uniref:ATP-binding protein n=1 Tax=Nocardia sp. NPDC058658 TaxID=3346580 RepID=UPI003654C7FE
MNEQEYRALARVQFSTALGPDSIWRPQSYHVEDLHRAASAEIARAIGLAKDRPDMSPTGFILNGDPGVGKTHLLGWIRQYVQDQGGFFFMPKLIDGESFWDGAVHGVMNRLIDADGGQLRRMLVALAALAGYDRERTARIAGPMRPKPEDIAQFLADLAVPEPQLVYECQDTLRALVLFRAGGSLLDVGDSFLILRDPLDQDVAREWGFRRGSRNAQLIFHDLIRLFGAAGPVVIALDQIDAVMADSASAGGSRTAHHADSLMKLREETVRTIIVAACIPTTWQYLKDQGLSSAADRFTELYLETALPGAPVATAVVAGHLAVQYDEVDFTPSYPTWPIAASAFDATDVTRCTPRRLLQLVAEHVRDCLRRGEIRELADFADIGNGAEPTIAVPLVDSSGFDDHFTALRDAADISTPLDPGREDEVMVGLLKAALQCFVLEQRDRDDLSIDSATATGRALHARLLRTIDPVLEDQEHWSFRAIGHTHHLAVQSRMRSAVIESGIEESSGTRHLTILRNIAFSKGPKTAAMLDDLHAVDGATLPISHDDLRTFTALQQMLAQAKPGFDAWLVHCAPAGNTQLFQRVFGDLPEPAAAQGSSPEVSKSVSDDRPDSGNERPIQGSDEPTVVLGRGLGDDREFVIPLELLRKHLVLFASSGSGKTVLLRRLVEEVALHGVSVIVLDVNNDLSRLGDAWQQAPAAWRPGDAEKAERYLAETDVVVWTPRRQAGRPLILNPLPDFAAVLDDPDELRTAVEVAAGDLLARSGIARTKSAQARAVLLQTLTHFARSGETKLTGLIDLLAELPDGVSRVRNAAGLAAEMADGLTVSMINDPLFGGDGEPLDPGVLLTPAPGKKARVSVVSCVGLPDPDQRATFVSQLQVALFTYFKTHPAGDRPLGALLVLDEAQMLAPSGKSTPASASTLMLAAQARKYGLGIAYATQAPKGLDNKVVGNTAVQFFGKLGTAVQIQAAKGIAATWGGNVDDIGRLKTGQFYGATEGRAFRKLATPLCLTHHPASPPTEAEVLERARREEE